MRYFFQWIQQYTPCRDELQCCCEQKNEDERSCVNYEDAIVAPAIPLSVPKPKYQLQATMSTVTFFMYDIVGGPNSIAKPLCISESIKNLLNPNGLIPPTTSAGGIVDLPFQNGGPLPLTFPSCAIPRVLYLVVSFLLLTLIQMDLLPIAILLLLMDLAPFFLQLLVPSC